MPACDPPIHVVADHCDLYMETRPEFNWQLPSFNQLAPVQLLIQHAHSAHSIDVSQPYT